MRDRLRRCGALALLAVLGCSAPSSRPPAEPSTKPTGERGAAAAEIPARSIERAIPRVVLLLARSPDGRQGYGAGVLLPEPGLVLTNLHVVAGARELHLLRYRPDRTSYSPLDGGISRLVFENEPDLEPARLLRGDPVADLAVVKVAARAIPAPPLPIRSTPPRQGERVFALGHPKESVWSFTAGVVSATHQGVIQHDAPINQGNSGGPLIDARGRLLGINTMKLLGGTEGIGFARPIALAAPLIDEASAPVAVERSTPELAMASCERALEIQPRAVDSCIDWSSRLQLAEAVAEEAARLLALDPDDTEALVQSYARDREAALARRTRARVIAHLSAQAPPELAPLPAPEPFSSLRERARHLRQHDVASRIRAAWSAHRRAKERWRSALRARTGLQVDVSRDGAAYRDVRRMGLRVEDVHRVAGGAAWVLVGGRNLDGSPFRYAECWHHADDGWRQPLFCSGELDGKRPADWPPSLFPADLIISQRALSLAAEVAGVELKESDPAGGR